MKKNIGIIMLVILFAGASLVYAQGMKDSMGKGMMGDGMMGKGMMEKKHGKMGGKMMRDMMEKCPMMGKGKREHDHDGNGDQTAIPDPQAK